MRLVVCLDAGAGDEVSGAQAAQPQKQALVGGKEDAHLHLLQLPLVQRRPPQGDHAMQSAIHIRDRFPAQQSSLPCPCCYVVCVLSCQFISAGTI